MHLRNNWRRNVSTHERVNFSQSETSSLLRGGGLNFELLLWGRGRGNRKDPNSGFETNKTMIGFKFGIFTVNSPPQWKLEIYLPPPTQKRVRLWLGKKFTRAWVKTLRRLFFHISIMVWRGVKSVGGGGDNRKDSKFVPCIFGSVGYWFSMIFTACRCECWLIFYLPRCWCLRLDD